MGSNLISEQGELVLLEVSRQHGVIALIERVGWGTHDHFVVSVCAWFNQFRNICGMSGEGRLLTVGLNPHILFGTRAADNINGFAGKPVESFVGEVSKESVLEFVDEMESGEAVALKASHVSMMDCKALSKM